MIKSSGYQATFLYFGVAQGLVVFVLGWFLRKPDAEFDVARAVAAVPVQRDCTPLLKPLRAGMRK